MTQWQREDLDELHSNLWALLTFVNDDYLKIDDITIRNHVLALKRNLDDLLFKYGGRIYSP